MAGETATIYRDELRPVGTDTVTIKATDGAGQVVEADVLVSVLPGNIVSFTATPAENTAQLDWVWP